MNDLRSKAFVNKNTLNRFLKRHKSELVSRNGNFAEIT